MFTFATDWVPAHGISNGQNHFSYLFSVGRRRYRRGRLNAKYRVVLWRSSRSAQPEKSEKWFRSFDIPCIETQSVKSRQKMLNFEWIQNKNGHFRFQKTDCILSIKMTIFKGSPLEMINFEFSSFYILYISFSVLNPIVWYKQCNLTWPWWINKNFKIIIINK